MSRMDRGRISPCALEKRADDEWEAAARRNSEAPLARESAALNPTDRGKKNETKYADRRKWGPVGYHYSCIKKKH
jgi:hypothetical protein